MNEAWVLTTTLYKPTKGRPVGSSSNFVDLRSAVVDGRRLRRKDVLKVGRYFVGGPDGKGVWWEATPAMLKEAADNFRRINAELAAANAAREFNLVKGHGDPVTKQVAHDDIVTPIQNITFDGKTLYADFGLTDDEVAEYRKPGKGRVSVRFVRQWTCPTTGKTYNNVLVHVALVDQPVVGGQGGWVDLQAAADAIGKGTTMEFANVLDGVNKLLGYWGLSMPAETTEENFDSMLSIMLQQIEALEGGSGGEGSGEGSGEATPPGGEAGATGDQNAQLAASVKSAIDLALAPIRSQLTELRQEKSNEAERKFRNRVKDAAAAGVKPTEINRVLDLGSKYNWDENILDLAEAGWDKSGVDLSAIQSRRFATNTPPKRKGGEQLDQAKIDAAAASLGGTRTTKK